MKNSNLCRSIEKPQFVNETQSAYVYEKQSTIKNERSTFIGDDIDYAYPFSHRYDEPFSDRGASDE